jgi:hypothetical protein
MESPQHIADSTPNPPPAIPAAPTFYLTARQPFSPTAILLAILAAAASLAFIVYAMAHSGAHLLPGGPDSSRSAGGNGSGGDDTDDPNQIDTIVLGDPTEAPRPAHRGDSSANKNSSVHPFLLTILPHAGDHFGQIPDSPAGHLLYNWLAAFNQPNAPALAAALPTAAPASTLDAQWELRRQTGGFTLLSSREPQPGLIVFRLRDQAKAAHEVLGTLWLRPNSDPPAIASFSLRALPTPTRSSPTSASSAPAPSP